MSRSVSHLVKAKMPFLPILGFVLWLMLEIVNLCNPISFYFQSSVDENAHWFPHLYLLTFLSFHLIFPLIYDLILLGSLRSRITVGLPGFILAMVFLTIVIVLIQVFLGFYTVSALMFFLFPAFLIIVNRGKINHWLNSSFTFIYSSRALSGSFIFLVYIMLCLILPRFHPFAHYIMFNKFPDETYVFLLRDEKNNLIPIQKYSTLYSDQFYCISQTISEKNKTLSTLNPGKTMNDKAMGDELIDYFFKSLKPAALPFDSVSLNKLSFTLNNGEIIRHDELFGTYKTPVSQF